MSERIFNVSRSTKTGKTVNVGDFPTVEQAQAAMLSHYKVTPMMCPSRRAVPAGIPTRSRLPRCPLAHWEIRSRRFMPPPS